LLQELDDKINTQKKVKNLELDALYIIPKVVVSQYGASTSVLLRGAAKLLLCKGEIQRKTIMTTLSSIE
jgi:hypothetical protein